MSSPGATPSPSDDPQHAPEPHEDINAYENADARAAETNQSSPLARASGGEGMPPADAPLHGEAPEVGGTGAGDPLAGVRISDDDAENAVPGDDGPEHPGVRRNT